MSTHSSCDHFRINVLIFQDVMLFSVLEKYQLSEKTADCVFRVEVLNISILVKRVFETCNRNMYCILFLSFNFTEFEINICNYKYEVMYLIRSESCPKVVIGRNISPF
jgi:hypothetical protein